jgi:hypothetical protein
LRAGAGDSDSPPSFDAAVSFKFGSCFLSLAVFVRSLRLCGWLSSDSDVDLLSSVSPSVPFFFFFLSCALLLFLLFFLLIELGTFLASPLPSLLSFISESFFLLFFLLFDFGFCLASPLPPLRSFFSFFLFRATCRPNSR